ncbi:uncharacterized protein LOC129752601 [Uranotaenia lowii]|uniref:uncharacterized protein LOC129752601 n=1 Tax=Uranotaenia lowii TaxID=190385 RepID=UPI002479B363|nr:uncharacterized protein LOC129752601 [Uranotaenia lowii]
MFKFVILVVAITVFSDQSEGTPYAVPQRPCTGDSFCGGPPNSFLPRYPSRVGVSPAGPAVPIPADHDDDSIEFPEPEPPKPAAQVGPADENPLLPVSVCVQLPPKTPLKFSKSILQQIIYSLTDGSQDVEVPAQVTISTVPPTLPPQPIYPPLPVYPKAPVIAHAKAAAPAVPVPVPVDVVIPTPEPYTVAPETVPPTLAPVYSQTPRYPTNNEIPKPIYSAPSRPSCYGQGSCRSDMPPRYNN